MTDKRLGFLYDPIILDHRPPEGHPERPARVGDTFALLESEGILDRLTRLPVTPATRAQIERVHTPAYLDRVERIVEGGEGIWMRETRSPRPAPGKRRRRRRARLSGRWRR